jgi:hypothetical protein
MTTHRYIPLINVYIQIELCSTSLLDHIEILHNAKVKSNINENNTGVLHALVGFERLRIVRMIVEKNILTNVYSLILPATFHL